MYFFHNSFQYFTISAVVNYFVAIIIHTPWDSIEEMNKVVTVVAMHGIFAALFVCFNVIWKWLLPEWKYVLSTQALKESNPSIETSKEIENENSPPKYSELFEPTYITIKE